MALPIASRRSHTPPSLSLFLPRRAFYMPFTSSFISICSPLVHLQSPVSSCSSQHLILLFFIILFLFPLHFPIHLHLFASGSSAASRACSVHPGIRTFFISLYFPVYYFTVSVFFLIHLHPLVCSQLPVCSCSSWYMIIIVFILFSEVLFLVVPFFITLSGFLDFILYFLYSLLLIIHACRSFSLIGILHSVLYYFDFPTFSLFVIPFFRYPLSMSSSVFVCH